MDRRHFYPLSGDGVSELGSRRPQAPFVIANDVKWTSLGRSENDSMPIGNCDLAANVWTEQNGDLVLLVAKSDAWAS